MRAMLLVLGTFLGIGGGMNHFAAAASGPAVFSEVPLNSAGTFAVVGDTQRTLFWEWAFLFRERNDREREILMQDIATQRLDFLAMSGDLVGYNDADHWEYFDSLTLGLRARGIPVLPVFGNHDDFGSPDFLTARFPLMKERRYYSRAYNRFLLVWLDSNRGHWSDAEWADQVKWLRAELGRGDQDPSVDGILIFTHHPPFTNSTVTGDEKEIQEAFLPAFTASRKTLAWISGHAHAYEHFLVNGKHFVVSGGGGGPRVTLLEGSERRHEDLFQGPSPRPFHYLLVRPLGPKVSIEVRGLDKGESRVRLLDAFTLP